MNEVIYPWWAWVGFATIIFAALAVDLGLFNRKAHAPSYKETIAWSVVWVSLALIFNGFIFLQFGSTKGSEFLTGYLIELSLSIGNLFVFLLIFTYFQTPKQYQHRVLFWGVFAALVMRMAAIFVGTTLVEMFDLAGEAAAYVFDQTGNLRLSEAVHHYEHIPINVSLGIVVVSIALSIILSLVFPPSPHKEKIGDF